MRSTRWGTLAPQLVLVSVLLLAAGCGGGAAPAGPGGDGGTGGATCDGLAPASLDDVFAATLAPNGAGGCALSMCHGGNSTSGMNFTDAQSFYDQAVGVASTEDPSLKRVAPGDPDHSYLYQKLLPGAGTRMPLGGPYLDSAAMAQIAGWICAGAPPPGAATDGGTLPDGGTRDGGTPAPVITALTPSQVFAGDGAFTLTLTGTGFASDATVTVGGVTVSATFVSATTLTASVDASLVADGATLPVVVTDPTPTAVSSAPVDLVVDNPAPVITVIQPAAVATGGAPFTLQVTGSGFVPSASVTLDGTAVSTTFVSATRLTAGMPSFQAPGSHAIAVVNPAPGGGTSASASLTASATTGPTLTGLAPASAAANTAFTLAVTGSGYACQGQKSVVTFGTATLTPTSCTQTRLDVAVPATPAGTYPVTVTNPGTGMTSNAVAFDVSAPNPVPTLTAITPAAVSAGSGAFTLTVTGTGFVPASTVDVDGSARTTHYLGRHQRHRRPHQRRHRLGGDPRHQRGEPRPRRRDQRQPHAHRGRGEPGAHRHQPLALRDLRRRRRPHPHRAGLGLRQRRPGDLRRRPGDHHLRQCHPGPSRHPGELGGHPRRRRLGAGGGHQPVPGGGTSGAVGFGLATQQVTFTQLQTGIFTPTCAKSRCHVTGVPTSPMSLEAGKAYGNLVGVASTECASRLRVQACGPTPASSYLVAKITGTDICQGSQMPKVGSLTAAQIQQITDWIAEGAPNN